MMSGENQKTILLVEDEAVTAMAGKITLEKYGNKVLIANSGEEAVKTVEKTPAIDLVLMDINLGAGIDGTEAAEIILKNHDLPVVFLSGHTEAEVVGKTEKITSYGYIIKSSSNTVLDASIKMAFKLFEAKTREKEKESQREAALEALREERWRLQSLIENIHVGTWEWNVQTGELAYNDMWAQIIGYTLAELAPISIKTWESYIHPDDLKHSNELLERYFAGELPNYGNDCRMKHKDGHWVWVHDHGRVITRTSDGKPLMMFGTHTDITEHKRVEEAMTESEVRFRELFNRMSSGVAIYEAVDDGGDFIIRDFNPAAEKIEKVSRQNIFGKRVSEAFPGVKALGVFQVFQRVWQTGKPEYFPENLYKPEGGAGSWRETWRESWIFKLPSGEIVAIYNDISERKQAGEEIKRQLAEKMILLKEVHHRIKNNIASIGGFLSLQAQAVTNPEAIAVLQDAIGRVTSMQILYDKLLLTEGYKDISVKNYVETLAASVVALFPENAKITLDQRIADFQLDAKQLSPLGIIINELFTNIMKHAFINRDTGLITISLTNINKHVTLTIQDDGNGLPAGFGINRSTGFGLMLVKMLSQQLGGSFSIKMHEGTLCTVEFNI